MTLRELAEQAVNDPGRTASLLMLYAAARGWDEARLAEALECPLVTRDARLARTSGHGARVDVL